MKINLFIAYPYVGPCILIQKCYFSLFFANFAIKIRISESRECCKKI